MKITKLYRTRTTYCSKEELDNRVKEMREQGCKIESFGTDFQNRGVIVHSVLIKENKEDEEEEKEKDLTEHLIYDAKKEEYEDETETMNYDAQQKGD